MNEVEIVEGGHYKMDASVYIDDLYIVKLVRIKNWFRWVDWIVYKSWKDSNIEQVMTLKKFKSKVLYKVNK